VRNAKPKIPTASYPLQTTIVTMERTLRLCITPTLFKTCDHQTKAASPPRIRAAPTGMPVARASLDFVSVVLAGALLPLPVPFPAPPFPSELVPPSLEDVSPAVVVVGIPVAAVVGVRVAAVGLPVIAPGAWLAISV